MLPAKASIRKERETALSIGIWRHLKSGKIINGIITGFPTIHVQSAIINMFMEPRNTLYFQRSSLHGKAKQKSDVFDRENNMDGGSPAYILLNVLRSLHYYIQLYISYIIFRVSTPLFFADPDPGKNLHADPDPDPGGIRGGGGGWW